MACISPLATGPASRSGGVSDALLWEALIQHARGEQKLAREAYLAARNELALNTQPPGLDQNGEIASVELIILERETRRLFVADDSIEAPDAGGPASPSFFENSRN